MEPLVAKLWPELTGQIGEKMDRARVEAAVVDRAQNAVYLTLRAEELFLAEECHQLEQLLSGRFEGFSVSVRNALHYDQMDGDTVLTLAEELKQAGLPINGFLQGARVTIDGQTVTVDVRHGDHLLNEIGFAEKLALHILKSTGVRPQVVLTCTDRPDPERVEAQLMAKNPTPAAAAPVRRGELRSVQGAQIKVDGLELTDTPPKLVNGHSFKVNNVVAIKDLGQDSGKVTVWGDVFANEMKGTFRKIYSISITDKTSSINLKIRAELDENTDRWDNIKPGDTLIVKGICNYDRYENDYVITPFDVLKVERRKREDHAPEKAD